MIVVILDRTADMKGWISNHHHVRNSRPNTHLLVLVLLAAEEVVSSSSSLLRPVVKNLLVDDWVARWAHHSKSHLTVVSTAQARIHLLDLEFPMVPLAEVDAISLLLAGRRLLDHHLLHVQMNRPLLLADRKVCATLPAAVSLIRRLSDRLLARSRQRQQRRMDLLRACTHLAWRLSLSLRRFRRTYLHQARALPTTGRLSARLLAHRLRVLRRTALAVRLRGNEEATDSVPTSMRLFPPTATRYKVLRLMSKARRSAALQGMRASLDNRL